MNDPVAALDRALSTLIRDRGPSAKAFAWDVMFLFKRELAQAGEAGTAETVELGSVHEHAVRKADAPK